MNENYLAISHIVRRRGKCASVNEAFGREEGEIISSAYLPNQRGVTAERLSLGAEIPGSNLTRANRFFSRAKKLIGTAKWPSSLEMLIEPSPHSHAHPSSY